MRRKGGAGVFNVVLNLPRSLRGVLPAEAGHCAPFDLGVRRVLPVAVAAERFQSSGGPNPIDDPCAAMVARASRRAVFSPASSIKWPAMSDAAKSGEFAHERGPEGRLQPFWHGQGDGRQLPIWKLFSNFNHFGGEEGIRTPDTALDRITV